MKLDALFLCLLAGLSVAQARELSLAECLKIAAERDPQWRIDSLAREASVVQEQSANAAWRPSLTANASYNRLSELDGSGFTLPFPPSLGGPRTVEIAPNLPNQYGGSLRVDQLVWDGHRARRNAQALRHDQAAWDAATRKGGRELTAKVATAYWNLGASQTALEAARIAMARADSQALQAAIAFRQGTALEQDTLQARLRTRQLELQIEQAEAARELASQTLRVLLGLDGSTPLALADPLVPIASGPAQAGQERPELRSAREQILSASELVEAARAGLGPTVQASAQYDLLNPNPRIVPNHDEFDATWRVGLQASWNIYRGGSDDLSIRKAQIVLRQARLREVAVRDALAQEISRRETELRLARRRREIAARNLPLAVRDLELASIRAQAGTALRLEAIDRSSALAQAQADLSQAVASENIAVLNLSLARGEEPRWK